MDPSEEAPSKIACNDFLKVIIMDFDAVYRFGKKVGPVNHGKSRT